MKKSNKAVTPGETHAIAEVQRSILPIPDAQHVGLTTFDAKDPDTAFPPEQSELLSVILSAVMNRFRFASRF